MVKINREGKEVDISITNPTGWHLEKYMTMLSSSDPSKFIKIKFEITAELSGLTVDEVKNLELTESSKLINAWEGKLSFKGEDDFLQPSSKSVTPSPSTPSTQI